MKHVLTCALTLLTLLTLTAPAFADVLWTPGDNPFFYRHRRECELEERCYYANGEKGFITAWDAPDGDMVRLQYQNGEKLRVEYIYQDWALIYKWQDHTEISGWVPLDDLYLIYDHISFAEEFGDQFQDYNGEFADYDGEIGEKFLFWEYPCAYEPNHTVKVSQRFLDALTGKSDKIYYRISKVYVDQNDQRWGYVELLDNWLLLDNPTCDGIMTSCIPEADVLINSGEIVAPQEPVLPGPSRIPYILVTTVVIATACLLKIFWKKQKNKTRCFFI